MDRRNFALMSLSAFVAPAAATAVVPGETHGVTPSVDTASASARIRDATLPIRMGEPVKLNIKSAPVNWQGHPVHLITLASIRCEVDAATKRMAASLDGSLLTFDDVDYDISAVVFDRGGALLGAARAVCKVPRIWLGVYAMRPVALKLDFGRSNQFDRVSRVMVAISDRDVLTPDQWQKDGNATGESAG